MRRGEITVSGVVLRARHQAADNAAQILGPAKVHVLYPQFVANRKRVDHARERGVRGEYSADLMQRVSESGNSVRGVERTESCREVLGLSPRSIVPGHEIQEFTLLIDFCSVWPLRLAKLLECGRQVGGPAGSVEVNGRRSLWNHRRPLQEVRKSAHGRGSKLPRLIRGWLRQWLFVHENQSSSASVYSPQIFATAYVLPPVERLGDQASVSVNAARRAGRVLPALLEDGRSVSTDRPGHRKNGARRRFT